MNQNTGCLVEGVREQQALTPKDTIQNFQFCSVEEQTYSSNILRMWSKRWRVMGTPVAGSCSWHRLWGTISVVGPCSGGWEPEKFSRSCQPVSHSQGHLMSLEHQPSHRKGLRRDSQLGGAPGRPAMSSCSPGTAACPAWLPQSRQCSPPSPPATAPLLDGAIELLDLLPQTQCLILQSCPLLLQLADVLSCLLQGGGLADLGAMG